MRPIPPRYNPGRPRPRPGVQQPRPINFPPEIINPVRPGMQQPVPRDPGYGSGPRGPIFLPRPDGTLQNMHPAAGGIRPGGIGPLPNNFGPMQGVGDPRLRAETIPGNQAPMQQQPLPTAPNFGGPVPQGGNSFVNMFGQQPLPTAPNFGGPVPQGGNSFVNMFGQQPAPLQQAPMQQFSYGGRAGYQMGGILGLENGQEEPIFPRLETLSENLGQAEQTLGAPSNDQFNASSITTAITGRPQMNRGGSPEEEMENIKEFYYGRRRGEQEDLLDEYERFKMRKDFLRRYPRDEARFGGRMGYVKGGITSLDKARQVLQRKAPRGEFLAYINPREAQMLKAYGGAGVDINGTGIPSYFLDDFVGDIFDAGGDILGGIADVGGDIIGGIGDVLGSLDLGQLASLYNFAGPMMGLPPIPGMGGPMSFLPGSIPGGEGGLGSLGNILGNFGSFMPQEGGGGGGGFNPFEFGANLISSGGNLGPMESNVPSTPEIIVNLLRKFLSPESIAGTAGTTIGKLTYDEMKRLNALREKEFEQYKQGKAKKRTQYRTAEGRESLPGYDVTGVPQTTADVFRAPAMKGGIMNVPTGQPRRNSVGVKEIDYRQSGGFVPPIGVKEKADDIPAMLSNNEFVFTADAVRAAGGGSVNKGAQKMYRLMKQLEGRS
jgi:hypothetical protein